MYLTILIVKYYITSPHLVYSSLFRVRIFFMSELVVPSVVLGTGLDSLVPVFEGIVGSKTCLLCDARSLHSYVESGEVYATWIKHRIVKCRLIENKHYTLVMLNPIINGGRGGNRKLSYRYLLTLEGAKHVALAEWNDKGFAVRDYFISIEEKAIILLEEKAARIALLEHELSIYKSLVSNQSTSLKEAISSLTKENSLLLDVPTLTKEVFVEKEVLPPIYRRLQAQKFGTAHGILRLDYVNVIYTDLGALTHNPDKSYSINLGYEHLLGNPIDPVSGVVDKHSVHYDFSAISLLHHKLVVFLPRFKVFIQDLSPSHISSLPEGVYFMQFDATVSKRKSSEIVAELNASSLNTSVKTVNTAVGSLAGIAEAFVTLTTSSKKDSEEDSKDEEKPPLSSNILPFSKSA